MGSGARGQWWLWLVVDYLVDSTRLPPKVVISEKALLKVLRISFFSRYFTLKMFLRFNAIQ